MARSLEGIVCLVTGASRGIGRGIALGLGECGATVYITGTSLHPSGGAETGGLTETATLISQRGGKSIPVVVDHSEESQVKRLFEQIEREQSGRLDVLVNNAYSAVNFFMKHNGLSYWEPCDKSHGEVWDTVNNVGLRNHYICSAYATKMMVKSREQNLNLPTAVIVNISSIGSILPAFHVTYGVGKAALDRMTFDMAQNLKSAKANVTILSLWPGLVRTEKVVAAATDGMLQFSTGIKLDLAQGESTEFSGRVLARLVAEPQKQLLGYSGRCLITAELAEVFNICDIDNTRPKSFRCVSSRLMHAGWTRLAWFIPSFVKIPFWMISIFTSKF